MSSNESLRLPRLELHSSSGVGQPPLFRFFVKSLRAVLRRLGHFLLLAVLLAIWEAIAGIWLPTVDRNLVTLMPPPSAVGRAAWELILSGDLAMHLGSSLKRELTAFCFALTAIPIGIAMGWWRTVHEQVDPIVELLRPIPPIAWIPLSLLWFGIGDAQNQFIIFLGIFFPVLINTIAGVKNIETNMIRASRSLGASEIFVLRRVVLPAALPQILTGVRVGFGFGWMALVAAELVGASSGLGFMINDARSVLRTDIILVGMLTIGLTGFAIDILVRRLSRWLLPWSLSATK